jgi:hypothetical protein
LIYYSPRRDPRLFDHKENETRIHDIYDDGVVIASDGLVYPGVDKHSGTTLTCLLRMKVTNTLNSL